MGQIIGNLGQAKTYKAQASVALAQGRAQKAAASKRAFNLEEEARSDSILAGKNMMRQRENQTAAQATVRNAIASSGFTHVPPVELQPGALAIVTSISSESARFSANRKASFQPSLR